MRTRLTDDEGAIRDLFVGFFANESPIETVRAAAPLGHDAGLWTKLREIGGPGMALPARAGGGDGSLRDLAVVIEAWGAALAPVPLVEHATAARLLCRGTAPTDVLADVISGATIATLALRAPRSGVAAMLPAGAVADVIVAFDGENGTLFRAPAPGLSVSNTADLPLADRHLSNGQALAITATDWQRAVDEWRALMAVAYVGLARRAIEIGVAYAKERIQFGVPIGTFQAIQHGYADAATRTEGAHLLAHRAVWALDTDQPDASRLTGMALLFAAESGRFATDRALQYHGGYGFAEEYDIQLYYRHAVAWILQLGEPGLEYARLADAEFGLRRAA